MNERIEVLLDRDHTLGHAYFMRLAEPGGNTLAALAQVFRGNVLPLLQEYFFEDWERIALVLNDLRKPVGRRFVHKPASNLDKLFGTDHALKLSDRRWQIDELAFGFIESYSGIVS
jgi:5-methylcytosine-specific restriction protein B